MADSTFLLAIWAIAQVVRAMPGIIWAIRCPPDSARYRFPSAGIVFRRSPPSAFRSKRIDVPVKRN